jgi:hypothetical protein
MFRLSSLPLPFYLPGWDETFPLWEKWFAEGSEAHGCNPYVCS